MRPYAIIKPTVTFAASPVDSFGQPNAVAPTAATNPVLVRAALDEASLTFQAQQTRPGIWFNDKAPVRGQLEFDFVDFTRSSPTTASVPRVRIAKVEWQLADSLLLVAGQDWDLFQPVNSGMYNLVGGGFQAGNTAFMRQQAKFIHTGESLELSAAVGLATNNNTARALVPEYNPLPTVALRAALLLGTTGRIGISAIGTNWRFAAGAPNERKALAGGVGAYGDLTPATGFNLRFEVYGGRNLGNLATLSLGVGNATDDIDEVGGFAFARYAVAEKHALYAHAGAAVILNDDKVTPAYNYGGAMPGATPAPAPVAVAGAPGMTQNMTARLGYEYRYDKMIAFVLEGFMFQSEHVLDQAFDAGVDGKQTALGVDTGLLFTF